MRASFVGDRKSERALYREPRPSRPAGLQDEGWTAMIERSLMRRRGAEARITPVICELSVMRRTARCTCRFSIAHHAVSRNIVFFISKPTLFRHTGSIT